MRNNKYLTGIYVHDTALNAHLNKRLGVPSNLIAKENILINKHSARKLLQL